MNRELSSEVNEEVKKKVRLFEQKFLKCELMMLIGVITGGDTNEVFWGRADGQRGGGGAGSAQRRK